MKKGDVIRQKCVNTTFYLTGICAHKVNNTIYGSEPLGELHKYALLVRAVGESNNVLFFDEA